MRQSERDGWMSQLSDERKARREEQEEFLTTIKGLADRIQHPETRHIETQANVEPIVHEPSKDWAELANIGNIVTDGGIGHPLTEQEKKLLEEDKEIEKVGTVIPETGQSEE